MDSKQKIIYTKNCLEFLDYKCVTPSDKNFRIYEGKNSVIPSMVDANFNDGFLNNWNWLMEVYDKLMKLPSLGDIKYPETGPLGIFTNIKYNIPDKEKTVHAINQFLTWYNETVTTNSTTEG